MDVVDTEVYFLSLLIMVHVLRARAFRCVGHGVGSGSGVNDEIGGGRPVYRAAGRSRLRVEVGLEDGLDELLILDRPVLSNANHRLTGPGDASLYQKSLFIYEYEKRI